MASNFFARQDRARTNTVWLVTLFLIAVVAIVATTSAIAYAAIEFSPKKSSPPAPELRWQVPVIVGAATVLIIVLGSMYKIVWLRVGGGQKVAESLGGVRLNPSSDDFEEKRLLNVVEEMALAAGTPVPPVYLLDENSINAFAAGYTPNTAVIGVTRGAVKQLTREQLQGVIAHEFSHILNGDMRMSIRLMGVLHGILLLGLLGRMLFEIFIRSGSGSRRSDGKGSGQIILIIIVVGVALIIIGSIGSFVGNLIKAAVSRQREFLADASAVQFTRNPSGIAGALKRIGGFTTGSTVKHGSAAEVSHMFFAKGIAHGFASWLATHPPLPERILAIEPNWNHTFITETPTQEQPAGVSGFAPQYTANFSGATTGALSEAPLRYQEVQDSLQHVGDPQQLHRQYAAQLLREIPESIKESAHDPFGSRAVIFALLLESDQELQRAQLAALHQTIEPQVILLTEKLFKTVVNLPARLRLPIIDLAMPALLSMTKSQYNSFATSLNALIAADSRLSIFEWGLSQIVLRHLAPNYIYTPPIPIQYYGLQKLADPVSHLLSLISHVGNDLENSQKTFRVGARLVPEANLRWLPPNECSLHRLEKDLGTLRQTAFKLRGQLLDACTACVCADAVIHPAEAELLRGIAELLDAPMPPVLPGMKLIAN